MRELTGRTAVVTGAASGIGRAMAERFAAEGMRVVLADVEQPALDGAVAAVTDAGGDAIGVLTDVADPGSVEHLRDAAWEAFGAVHVLCNNAGVGSGAQGRMWEHELNDWRWAMSVNVWGVVHGLNAFLPSMLAHGEPGHVVNTSSGNGGISPLPAQAVYATTKAAVTTISECLYAQLREIDAPIGASVLFPGPHMLRTGLWTSGRNRPAELAQARPPEGPAPTIEDYEAKMAAAGIDIVYTPAEEVADRVVTAIRAGNFWILPPNERTDDSIRRRAESMLQRENPTYLRSLAGE
jgi:NAD(P)-dependent dehydrogenase (short-subunit alcohol dehydrogenase family)